MNEVEFKAWPKIPRNTGNKVVITEKLDGTNACIVIQDDTIVAVQSRKRFITPEDDNFGFAAWVEGNTEELLKLGNGYHYGEWCGPGIQRNPMDLEEKALYLFNTRRWGKHNPNTPNCVKVVPVLYSGLYTGDHADVRKQLWEECNYTPEGVIYYFPHSNSMQKWTYENQTGKWRKSND